MRAPALGYKAGAHVLGYTVLFKPYQKFQSLEILNPMRN